MTYFKNVPKINYPYEGKMINQNSLVQTFVETSDLLVRFRIRDEILNSPNAFYEYNWKDSDRPDIVAKLYYGDANLHWLVMLSAQVADVHYDFPLRSDEFDDYLKKKYNVEEASELDLITHHYEDSEGYVVDYETFQQLNFANRKEVSVYDYEFNLNEEKRKIRLISRIYANDIRKEYEESLKKLKELRALDNV